MEKLAILIDKNENKELIKLAKEKFAKNNHDITIIKVTEQTEYDKEENKIIKTKKEKINLTSQINETAKLIKRDIAQEKINAIKEAVQNTINNI